MKHCHTFLKIPYDFFKFTTAEENVPDSPFEGGWSLEKASGDVSVPV
jgi:hypothetical protein